jgi:hypothetical protein
MGEKSPLSAAAGEEELERYTGASKNPTFPPPGQIAVSNLRKASQQHADKLSAYPTAISPVAKRLRNFSNALKFINIVAGTILATKGLFDIFFGSSSRLTLLITTVWGLLVALNGAVEASFQLEKRAIRLSMLAALCLERLDATRNRWRREIGTWEFDPSTDLGKQKLSTLHEIVGNYDEDMKLVRSQAVELGIDTTAIELSPRDYLSNSYRERGFRDLFRRKK